MSLRSKLRAVVTMGRGVARGITELEPTDDPITFFGRWFEEAQRAGIFMPEAMAVATCTADGIPSVRMMLLKSFGADGLVFYTNYESRKASELEATGRAALCLHWAILQRQVRVEGTVRRVSTHESHAYFRTRSRGSRIGAWASSQSAPLQSSADLERRFRECERQFDSNDIPLPPFWGGYRLTPERIEFWQGRANRLHDRLVYARAAGGWDVTRVYP